MRICAIASRCVYNDGAVNLVKNLRLQWPGYRRKDYIIAGGTKTRRQLAQEVCRCALHYFKHSEKYIVRLSLRSRTILADPHMQEPSDERVQAANVWYLGRNASRHRNIFLNSFTYYASEGRFTSQFYIRVQ